jgi:hypothetical protein
MTLSGFEVMPQNGPNNPRQLTDEQKETEIFKAINENNLGNLKLFADNYHHFLDIKEDGKTPLEIVSEKGYVDMVKVICDEIYTELNFLFNSFILNIPEKYTNKKKKYDEIEKKITDNVTNQAILKILNDHNIEHKLHVTSVLKVASPTKNINSDDWLEFFKNEYFPVKFKTEIITECVKNNSSNCLKAYITWLKEKNMLDTLKRNIKDILSYAIKNNKDGIVNYLMSNDNTLLTPAEKEEVKKNAIKFGRSRRKSKKSRRKLRSKKLRKLRNKFSIKKV